MAKTYYRVLSIAGSDPAAGAGIQADLKTCSALGCYGMTAVTALTIQNTMGVSAPVQPLPPSFVRNQILAILDDIGTDAVKIGMLYSREIVRAVADALKARQVKNIVLDPVLRAQSGQTLQKNGLVEAIKEFLLPIVDLVTPNIPEASILIGKPLKNFQDLYPAARDIAELGPRHVLIKSGHLKGDDMTDLLYSANKKRFIEIPGTRIITSNDHGTGCTLSSAIASYLAKGISMEESAKLAKKYLSEALEAGSGYTLGRGRGPLCHFLP